MKSKTKAPSASAPDEVQSLREELEAAKARLVDLYDRAPVGYFTLTRRGVVHDANITIANLVGCPRSELIGRPAASVIAEDYRDAFSTYLRRLAEDAQPRACDLRMQHENGSSFYAHWDVIRIKERDDGTLYKFVITDVSESKKLEEELRQSEQRLKFHSEYSPLAVVEWDSDFLVTQWSNEAERVFGWKKEEILGKRIDTLNIVFEEDLPIVERTMSRLMGGQERTVVSSNRNYTKAGEVLDCVWYNSVLLDEQGRMSSVMSRVQNVTEQKREHEALQQSEARFRTMANAIPQLAWMAKPDGYIYWYNDRWFEYTGATPREMQGWGWERVHDPEVLPSVRERWRESIATGAPFDMEFPLRGADGHYHPFLTRVMPLKDDRGKVLQWFGTNTDIMERKKMEVKLRTLYEQTQADAVTKADLLNEVNHRVKNNLMMILGLVLAERRRAESEGTPGGDGVLDRLWSRINGLLHVHQMLSDAQWLPINVMRLAERIGTAVIASAQRAGAPISLSAEPSTLDVPARHAGNLAIVLNELTTNSIKYAFEETATPVISVSCRKEGRMLQFIYRDNGCGYPEHVLKQTHRYQGGLGLIRRVVEHSNGGKMELACEEGAVTILSFEME